MISGSHSYRPRWIEMSWETDSTYPSQTRTREPTKTVCCALLSFQLRFAFRHLYSFHITIKRSAGGSVGMAPPSRNNFINKNIMGEWRVSRPPPRICWSVIHLDYCERRLSVCQKRSRYEIAGYKSADNHHPAQTRARMQLCSPIDR